MRNTVKVLEISNNYCISRLGQFAKVLCCLFSFLFRWEKQS